MIPKFRAWLKKEQKMDNYIDHISWLEDELYCIGDGITYMVSAEDLVLMQSTGLKDKNGKEIFEGDILACKTDDEVINLNIFWDEEHALFMFESKKYNEQEPLAELVENNTYPFEIIGNIYENPELLEDKE